MTPLIQALVASQTAITEAMKKDDCKKVTLIDNRGIGKPDKYTMMKVPIEVLHRFNLP